MQQFVRRMQSGRRTFLNVKTSNSSFVIIAMYRCNILRSFGSHFSHHERHCNEKFQNLRRFTRVYHSTATHTHYPNHTVACNWGVVSATGSLGDTFSTIAPGPIVRSLITFSHKYRHFFNSAWTSTGTELFSDVSDSDLSPLYRLDGEIVHLLVLMAATCAKEIVLAEKLKLLQLVVNCDSRDVIIRSAEFASLMFDIGRSNGQFKRDEMVIYNKACQQLSDSLWNNASTHATNFNEEIYQQQFGLDLTKLHSESLCPTLEQYRGKYELINGLKPLLEPATGGVLHAFGSCENGLWVRGSDIDVCLHIPACHSKQHWLSKLNLVKSSLINCEIISRIQIISQAMVPIAKLYNHESENVCDISINNTVALDNTSYVKLMAQIDHRVVKLARFIKYWATCRCINNRSQGSLSSYTLILQLFHLLQNRHDPILPKYRDIELFFNVPAISDSCNDTSNGSSTVQKILESCGYLGKNKESIVELLFDFFRVYSGPEFQGGFYGTTCDLYSGETTRNNLGVLVIKCPITGKNVNPFTIGMWQSIYGEFKRAYEAISAKQPLYMLCQVAQRPPMQEQMQCYNENALALHRIFESFLRAS